MINEFKEYLLGVGFQKFDRKTFVRAAKPVSALVCEVPGRVGENRTRLQVGVEVFDPFVELRDYHVLNVTGDVTTDAICVHHHPTSYWIVPDQKEAIFGILKTCLPSWFDHWCEPRRLISYFETPVDIVVTKPRKTGSGCQHEYGEHQSKRQSPNVDYLLSLLYQHIGDHKKALLNADRLLEFYQPLAKDTYEGEPDRTLRQIKFLSQQGSCC